MARKGRKSQRTGVRGQGPHGRSGFTEFEMVRKARERRDALRRRGARQTTLAVTVPQTGVSPIRAYVATATALRDAQRKAAMTKAGTLAPGQRPKRRGRVPTLAQLCEEYRKKQEVRRQSMFAKGSAGKGRRNTGPRQRSLLEEMCK